MTDTTEPPNPISLLDKLQAFQEINYDIGYQDGKGPVKISPRLQEREALFWELHRLLKVRAHPTPDSIMGASGHTATADSSAGFATRKDATAEASTNSREISGVEAIEAILRTTLVAGHQDGKPAIMESTLRHAALLISQRQLVPVSIKQPSEVDHLVGLHPDWQKIYKEPPKQPVELSQEEIDRVAAAIDRAAWDEDFYDTQRSDKDFVRKVALAAIAAMPKRESIKRDSEIVQYITK